MWPKDKMPDPVGGKRLLDLGCRVKYEKSHLVEPRKIRTPEDIRPGTKKGKLDRKPIWIVEIHMPKKIAFDMYRGYMTKMKAENEGIEDEANKAPAAAGAPAPMAGGMAPPMPGGAPAPIGGAPVGGAPVTGGAPAAV
jgi:hypothetical protein